MKGCIKVYTYTHAHLFLYTYQYSKTRTYHINTLYRYKYKKLFHHLLIQINHLLVQNKKFLEYHNDWQFRWLQNSCVNLCPSPLRLLSAVLNAMNIVDITERVKGRKTPSPSPVPFVMQHYSIKYKSPIPQHLHTAKEATAHARAHKTGKCCRSVNP